MRALTGQLGRFGVVGGAATLVHFVVALILLRFGLYPLLANASAFLCAFVLSYLGHSRWTFPSDPATRGRARARFLVIAVGGFLINQSGVAAMIFRDAVSPVWAIFVMAAVVAGLTFGVSKFWAFRE